MDSFGAGSNQSIDTHMLTVSMRNGDKFRVSMQLEVFNTIKDSLDRTSFISICPGDGTVLHWLRTADISSMTMSRQ